jgi:hypothetical protein
MGYQPQLAQRSASWVSQLMPTKGLFGIGRRPDTAALDCFRHRSASGHDHGMTISSCSLDA